MIGTAGAGKSTLVGAYSEWMYNSSYSTVTVNLDPGASSLPYEPDIDVRDLYTLEDVMDEYGLGPNGAQIVAADMLALNISKLLEPLQNRETQHIILDTPGQIELFTFREAAREMVKNLFPNRSGMVYLIDPFNARTPSGLISQLLLSTICRLRFGIPAVEAISKMDMITREAEDELGTWITHPSRLLDDAIKEADEGGLSTELNIGVLRILEEMDLFTRIHYLSSQTGQGMEDIYTRVQLTLGGGEDLMTL